MTVDDVTASDSRRRTSRESLWDALSRTFDALGDPELAADARRAGATDQAPGLALGVLQRAGISARRVREVLDRIPRDPTSGPPAPAGTVPSPEALAATVDDRFGALLDRFSAGELYAGEASELLRECSTLLHACEHGEVALELLDLALELDRRVGSELGVGARWHVSRDTHAEFVRLLAALGRYEDVDREIASMFLEGDPLEEAEWYGRLATDAPLDGHLGDAVPEVVDGLLQLGRAELRRGGADAAAAWFITARDVAARIVVERPDRSGDPGLAVGLAEFHLALTYRDAARPHDARVASRAAYTAALLSGRPRLAARSALLEATLVPHDDHGGPEVIEAASRAVEQAGIGEDEHIAASARTLRGLALLNDGHPGIALQDLLDALAVLERAGRWSPAAEAARGASEAARALHRDLLADVLAKRADSCQLRSIVPATTGSGDGGDGAEWDAPLPLG